MSSLFPIIQPENETSTSNQLPLCKEVAWDYEKGTPIFSGGNPVVVTGAEAVKVWVWKTLKTVRYRHDIYTWDYGCEVESLIGQAFTSDVKQSEAIRFVREALEPNPYITSVRQTSVDFIGSKLTITCIVDTVYGEVEVSV